MDYLIYYELYHGLYGPYLLACSGSMKAGNSLGAEKFSTNSSEGEMRTWTQKNVGWPKNAQNNISALGINPSGTVEKTCLTESEREEGRYRLQEAKVPYSQVIFDVYYSLSHLLLRNIINWFSLDSESFIRAYLSSCPLVTDFNLT